MKVRCLKVGVKYRMKNGTIRTIENIDGGEIYYMRGDGKYMQCWCTSFAQNIKEKLTEEVK